MESLLLRGREFPQAVQIFPQRGANFPSEGPASVGRMQSAIFAGADAQPRHWECSGSGAFSPLDRAGHAGGADCIRSTPADRHGKRRPYLGRPLRRRARRFFELQDQIASSVVGAIEPRLRQSEIERASRRPTESLGALTSICALCRDCIAGPRRVRRDGRSAPVGAGNRSVLRAGRRVGRLVSFVSGVSGMGRDIA
jgi:hypothetical protein